nr:YgiQ family radical SAM protein [Desulfovibrio cuneatus]
MNGEEMRKAGWNELDILLVSGDAYVDHPSFGIALLGRWLVAHGFRVGIVAQPQWENTEAGIATLQSMGRPRLFVGVTAGAIDSMLAHYTAFRKKRHDDAYTPGGQCGARPNRACIMYTNMVRRAFPHIPVVLGGIEASLRRCVHFDFWENSLRRPLLFDSKADLTVYGMGEAALLAIARQAQALVGPEQHKPDPAALRRQLVQACATLPGVASILSRRDEAALISQLAEQGVATEFLPSFEDITATPPALMQATLSLEQQVHAGNTALLQPVGDRILVCTPPQPPLEEATMDAVYDLPYTRLPHPSYAAPIPAWEMIRTSITTHRGCGGGCSFCSLALHQGRHIASRSKASIVQEAATIAEGPQQEEKTPRWAGSISDVGGPTANMWQARCQLPKGTCRRASCLHPKICPHFAVDQRAGVALLRAVQATPGVRHVRVASGVRYDLALQEQQALAAYTAEFTGGQLKVAPEHSANNVLHLMRKPGIEVFETFLKAFHAASSGADKEQYTVPYLMSAFPGCTLENMQELGRWLRQKNWSPQQVQCFIPTPGTVATAMFYAEVDTQLQPLYVAKTDRERLEQHHALLGGEGHQQHRTGEGFRKAPQRPPYGARNANQSRAAGNGPAKGNTTRGEQQEGRTNSRDGNEGRSNRNAPGNRPEQGQRNGPRTEQGRNDRTGQGRNDRTSRQEQGHQSRNDRSDRSGRPAPSNQQRRNGKGRG